MKPEGVTRKWIGARAPRDVRHRPTLSKGPRESKSGVWLRVLFLEGSQTGSSGTDRELVRNADFWMRFCVVRDGQGTPRAGRFKGRVDSGPPPWLPLDATAATNKGAISGSHPRTLCETLRGSLGVGGFEAGS